MITLIHGDDTTASRNFYFEMKKQAKDPLTLDGILVTLTDLQQALSGNDLFGTKKDIFIENLVSKRKSPKDIEVLVNVLIKSDANVVVWESKELTKKQTESFGQATVRLFKIPATIFALLDGLKPGNGKQLLQQYHKTLQDKDAEFILVMLQRQVRILLALCHPGVASTTIGSSKDSIASFTLNKMNALQNDTIFEVLRLAPWQKGKLEKQAKSFTTEQLIDLHSKLFDLELNMKTGKLLMPLADSIDLLLISI